MKKNILSLLAVILVACSSDEVENLCFQDVEDNVLMSIPDFTWEGATRTTLASTAGGVSFGWKEGDQVSVYAVSSMANFDVKSIRQDARSAIFDGGGFSLTAGNTYYALYPYNAWNTNKTAVLLPYTGQVQSANDDMSHLSAFDYMTSRTTAIGNNMADFHFSHVGAIMRFQVTLPSAGIYTQFKVTTSQTPFVTLGLMDLTSSSPIVTPIQTNNEMMLSLGENGVELTEGNLILTTYLITPPTELSHDELTLVVTDSQNNNYSFTVPGKKMEAGHAYGYQIVDPSLEGSFGGHDYVDLGLPSGTLWATCNLGAEKTTDFGKYYAWGETKAYGEEDITNLHNYQTKGTYVKTSYVYSTYKYSSASHSYGWTKYTIDDEEYKWEDDEIKCPWYDSEHNFIGDGLGQLTDEDDAALSNWGEGWTIPTNDQFQELVKNCTFVRYEVGNDSYNGVAGFKVKSILNGKSIFLPDAGYYTSSFNSSHSYYLSKNLSDSTFAFGLRNGKISSAILRAYGCVIRPVRQLSE